MNPNKIILVEVFSYVALNVLIYTLAPMFNNTSGGDAAGNGMSRGLLMLSILAAFFLIAIALTVTNYFVLKGVATSAGIRFLAFVPLIVSATHGVYTYFFT